tara:strand:+ start:1168 stop:1290 length:123 start_codon:yes stop_codon:yes gene_type:complete
MMQEEEEIGLAIFDIEKIRTWRKKERGVRDASARRPQSYL